MFYNLMIINSPVRIDYCEVGYRDDGIKQLWTVCEFVVYLMFYISALMLRWEIISSMMLQTLWGITAPSPQTYSDETTSYKQTQTHIKRKLGTLASR